jgi:hypothetical protein
MQFRRQTLRSTKLCAAVILETAKLLGRRGAQLAKKLSQFNDRVQLRRFESNPSATAV